MELLLATLFLSLLVGAFFFAGIGIRILLRKEGGFRGTCASQSPFLKNAIGNCQTCGKPVKEEGCWKPEDDGQASPMGA